MDKQQIESLLYESESDELDFKRDQYPLLNNDEKGELIKDILAFTNSWRRTDAFILIGVDQTKVAGRSTPVGIAHHLNDANLQQMLNSKTNHHVVFSYEEVSFQGLDLGVIKIPVQDRPRFLTKDFGKLKKDVVYVRRSSSTAEAALDEILRMKAGPATPSLDLQFADVHRRHLLSKAVTTISEIVVYDSKKIPLIPVSTIQMITDRINSNYPRQMASYIAETSLLNSVGFGLKNSATSLAVNIKFEAELVKPPQVCIVDEYDYPRRPQYKDFLSLPRPIINKNAEVDTVDNNVHLKVRFGNVQPGQTVWSNGQIYIGATAPATVDINGFLYGDNIPIPLPVHLQVKIQTKTRDLKMSELERRE
jgi:hypothetical protein